MRGAVLLTPAYQDWHCPRCGLDERTRPYPPNAARMHVCPALHMITAPMVPAGTDATLIANERQDYLGTEIQATGDDGRPYMSVYTLYGDGSNDCAVHAPVARAAITPD